MDYMFLKSGEVKTFTVEYMANAIPDLLVLHEGAGYYYTDRDGGWHGKVAGEPPTLGCAKIPDEEVPDIIKLAAMLE